MVSFFWQYRIFEGNNIHHLFETNVQINFFLENFKHCIVYLICSFLAKLNDFRLFLFLNGGRLKNSASAENNTRKIYFQFGISWSTIVLYASICLCSMCMCHREKIKEINYSVPVCEVNLSVGFLNLWHFCKRFFIIFIWCIARSTGCEFMCVFVKEKESEYIVTKVVGGGKSLCICVYICALGGQRHQLNWVSMCVCVAQSQYLWP